MKYTERIPDKHWENLRIWNNLVNQVLNLTQIIHLPALIKTISIQVSATYLNHNHNHKQNKNLKLLKFLDKRQSQLLSSEPRLAYLVSS